MIFVQNAKIPSRVARTLLGVVAMVALAGVVASAATVHVSHAPKISVFTVSTPTVSPFGGALVFGATTTNAKTCSLTVSPAIVGMGSATSCTPHFGETVNVPSNPTSKTVKYTFTLIVKGVGSVKSSLSVSQQADTAAITTSWGAPTTVETIRGIPTDVSCPSATTCVTVDAHGFANISGSPVSVDSVGLTSVSCVTNSFCVAVDTNGEYVVYNGTAWSTVKPAVGAYLTSVSCTTTTFCVAVDSSGDALKFNGTTWSTPVEVDSLGSPTSLSCVLTTFCAEVDNAGYAATFNGTSWSAPASIDTSGLTSLSCSAASNCVAGDSSGDAVRLSGVSWTTFSTVAPSSLVSLSCRSTTFCMAVDSSGHAVTFNGTNWSSPVAFDSANTPAAVSCPTSMKCVAVNTDGGASTWTGASWGSPVSLDATSGVLNTVACGSATFCLTVGTTGEYSVFNGASWSALAQSPSSDLVSASCAGGFCMVGSQSGSVYSFASGVFAHSYPLASAPIDGVSCQSSSFCLASDYQGNLYQWNGVSWSAPLAADVTNGRGFGAVACASTKYCVVNDHSEHQYIWTGSSNSFSKLDDLEGGDLTTVACPSAATCVAGDASGFVVAVNHAGTSYSFPLTHASYFGITGMSCVSSFYCVAVDTGGEYLAWQNGKWSAPTPVDSTAGFVSVSCSTNGTCVALDQSNRAYVAKVS